MGSAEFADRYGGNPDADASVTKLYYDVPHREPDPKGFAFRGNLVQEHGAAMYADVLAAVAESSGNVDQVAAIIGDGLAYTPYTGA